MPQRQVVRGELAQHGFVEEAGVAWGRKAQTQAADAFSNYEFRQEAPSYDDDMNQDVPAQRQSAPASAPRQAPAQKPAGGGGFDDFEDDIPF